MQKNSPYLSQPKAKTDQVIFLSDFMNINSQFKLNPYPMNKIISMLLKIEGFKCDTSLNMNMRYYNIQIRKDTNDLYTTMITRRK